MTPDRARVAAAIVAGGQATRLQGAEKGALLVQGRTILERQLVVLRPLFSRVLIVTNPASPAPDGLVAIHDRRAPGHGPLAGIEAALGALLPSEDGVVCVGGDMPFLSGPVLELLRDVAPAAIAVVPRVHGRPEPLLARYSRRCVPTLEAALGESRLKAASLLGRLDVHWIEEAVLRTLDPDLATLENVNTADDLVRANARSQAE